MRIVQNFIRTSFKTKFKIFRFLELIRLPPLPLVVKKYVIQLVSEQIEIREKQNVTRKDFIQLLIKIRNGGSLTGQETDWDIHSTGLPNEKTMSIEQCAAQIFIFYVAGSDTSASTVAYTIFECARNQDLQRRLQNEIDKTLENHSGLLTYDCVQEMKLLDLCVMGKINYIEAIKRKI